MRRKRITKITDQHLLNRIAYFERMLSEYPGYQAYMGDSEYAEQAVEEENRQNEELYKQVEAHIKYLKSEAKKRGLL